MSEISPYERAYRRGYHQACAATLDDVMVWLEQGLTHHQMRERAARLENGVGDWRADLSRQFPPDWKSIQARLLEEESETAS